MLRCSIPVWSGSKLEARCWPLGTRRAGSGVEVLTVTQRQERVGQLLKAVISEIIQQEIKDPRLGFVTITAVEPSVDLRHVRVFVSVLGTPEEEQASLKILTAAAGFIRGEVGRQIALRRVPEIDFRLDAMLRQASRIYELLNQINEDTHLDVHEV